MNSAIGLIVGLDPIEGSDNLLSASVVCGKGGKWRGIVNKKHGFSVGDKVEVFFPDALVPADGRFDFMKERKYRVSVAKFRNATSHVLIMLTTDSTKNMDVGESLDDIYGVKKYSKPIPAGSATLEGFPVHLVPKTDEVHLQSIEGEPPVDCVVTLKMDGTSMTVLFVDGELWVCSRNYRVSGGAYGSAVQKIDTAKLLSMYSNLALQCEVLVPNATPNSKGIGSIETFGFYVFDMEGQEYLPWEDTKSVFAELGVECVPEVCRLEDSNKDENFYVDLLSRLRYRNGNAVEGVVVRPVGRMPRWKNTFKYVNPRYKEG